MVWIISRHYNTDERMSGLMERIAEEMSDRVVAEINVPDAEFEDMVDFFLPDAKQGTPYGSVTEPVTKMVPRTVQVCPR